MKILRKNITKEKAETMVHKIFLDANVILDFTLQREMGYEAARKIIEEAIKGKVKGFVTPAVIHMCGYWLKKKYGIKITKEGLLLLLNDIKVIDSSHAITVQALHSDMTDVEDALQYYAALQHEMEFFISRDAPLKKAAKPSLAVYTPSEFIKLYLS